MIRLLVLILSLVATQAAMADERFITLSSTTSTEDSGLFGYILPIFHAATGIDVHVVAVGAGQALVIGMRGDADALLVHDRIGETRFVAEGYGIDRRDVMYDDFVIVGPSADPAHIRGLKDARTALTKLLLPRPPSRAEVMTAEPTVWNCDCGSRLASSPTRTADGIAILVKAWGRR